MQDEAIKKKKGLIIAAILILVFGMISVVNLVRFKMQKKAEITGKERIPVELTETGVVNLKWILEQTGDIRPIQEVDVYPKVPGKIIEKLLAEKGDFVKKGMIVAKLEDDTIKAQIAEAEAALESAKANLKQVEANLEVIKKDRLRLKNLFKEKAIARQRLDHIEAEYIAVKEGKWLAETQIKRAEAVLRQLEILNRDHSIYATITGYVSARYVDQGSMSDPRHPIFRISHEEMVKIVTTVTEKDFPHIKKGMKVEALVGAFPDKVFTGVITIINPTIDPITRTGEIEIHIPNENRALSSGMFAHIRLFLGERMTLAVERDALNKMAGTGSYFVYVVEEGRAVLKNIKTGISQGNLVEIIDGLEEGEQVVVKGQNRLKDGFAVLIVRSLKGGSE